MADTGQTSGGVLEEPGPVGLGGWMVLPALWTVWTPFSLFIDVIRYLRPLREIPENSPHWLWAVGSAGAAALLIIGMMYLIILMLRRSRAYPKWAIGLALAGLIHACASGIFYSVWIQKLSRDQAGGLITAGILTIGLVAYMRMSERVRNTFVN